MTEKRFHPDHIEAIRLGMEGAGATLICNPHTHKDFVFVGNPGDMMGKLARKLAEENDATVKWHPIPELHVWRYTFFPKVWAKIDTKLKSTVGFLSFCLPGHSSRDDVARMEDEFVKLEKYEDKYGDDDRRTRRQKAKAEKMEDRLLLEALKAALKSDRLMWEGICSI
jgi:hypothetical protein